MFANSRLVSKCLVSENSRSCAIRILSEHLNFFRIACATKTVHTGIITCFYNRDASLPYAQSAIGLAYFELYKHKYIRERDMNKSIPAQDRAASEQRRQQRRTELRGTIPTRSTSSVDCSGGSERRGRSESGQRFRDDLAFAVSTSNTRDRRILETNHDSVRERRPDYGRTDRRDRDSYRDRGNYDKRDDRRGDRDERRDRTPDRKDERRDPTRERKDDRREPSRDRTPSRDRGGDSKDKAPPGREPSNFAAPHRQEGPQS